jgi:hypothetical protein
MGIHVLMTSATSMHLYYMHFDTRFGDLIYVQEHMCGCICTHVASALIVSASTPKNEIMHTNTHINTHLAKFINS